MTPSVTIPARELKWSASRSGGPGGQNVNKVSSKVDLRFDLEASEALTDVQKSRVRASARNRLDEDGAIQIVVQDTRDQQKNLDLARERLAELIKKALVVPKARKATKPSRGSQRRRLNDKKRVGDKKRDRRPVDE
ncbi:MAG: aminoacyl-tRNA hydrolase [Sandaracinaceae bacterium]|nr:aminoacyl-tRNA hydrolase [Sandaracinaceae bacterium]